MKRKLRVERAVGTGVVVIGGLGCLVIGNLLAQDYNTVEPVSGPIETTSSVVATTETTTTVKHYTQTFPISAALSSTTETTEQPVPLYIYKDETVTREYSSWIQELYQQAVYRIRGRVASPTRWSLAYSSRSPLLIHIRFLKTDLHQD